MVRVELFAQDERYTLPAPSGALMLPDESTRQDLNQLLTHLLGELYPTQGSFEFKVAGRTLHEALSVGALCAQLQLSPEELLPIEYYLPFPEPRPEQDIQEPDWIRSVAIAPGGAASSRRIISGSFDRRVRLHPGQVATFAPAKDKVTSLAWLDHDHFIAGSGDGTISVWSVHDPARPLWRAGGCTSAIQAIAVAEDASHFFVGDFDGQICQYSSQPPAATDPPPKGRKRDAHGQRGPAIPVQTPLCCFQAHEGAIGGLFISCSPESALLSLGWDGHIKRWSPSPLPSCGLDPAPDSSVAPQLQEQHKIATISAAGHLGGLRFVTGHPDGTLRLIDLAPSPSATIIQERRLAAHEGWIMAIAMQGQTGRFASCGADGRVLLWDAADLSQPTARLEARASVGPQPKVLCVDWQDDCLVYGGEDKTLHILST